MLSSERLSVDLFQFTLNSRWRSQGNYIFSEYFSRHFYLNKQIIFHSLKHRKRRKSSSTYLSPKIAPINTVWTLKSRVPKVGVYIGKVEQKRICPVSRLKIGKTGPVCHNRSASWGSQWPRDPANHPSPLLPSPPTSLHILHRIAGLSYSTNLLAWRTPIGFAG